MERTRCECGGGYRFSHVWRNIYTVCCSKCGSKMTYFTSKPEDAEANAYLIWIDVLNGTQEE